MSQPLKALAAPPGSIQSTDKCGLQLSLLVPGM